MFLLPLRRGIPLITFGAESSPPWGVTTPSIPPSLRTVVPDTRENIMDLTAITELFENLTTFFGGFADVFGGLGDILESGAELSS